VGTGIQVGEKHHYHYHISPKISQIKDGFLENKITHESKSVCSHCRWFFFEKGLDL
jgi:hypothetical protein